METNTSPQIPRPGSITFTDKEVRQRSAEFLSKDVNASHSPEEVETLVGDLFKASDAKDKAHAEELERLKAEQASIIKTVLKDVYQQEALSSEMLKKLLPDGFQAAVHRQLPVSPSSRFAFVNLSTETTLTTSRILFLVHFNTMDEHFPLEDIHQDLDSLQSSLSRGKINSNIFPLINKWLMRLVGNFHDSEVIARALALLVESWDADGTCCDFAWLSRQSQRLLEHEHGPLVGACYRRLVLLAETSGRFDGPQVNLEGTSAEALLATESPIDCFLAGPKDKGASWSMILKSSVDGDERQIMIYYEPHTTPAKKSTLAGKRLLVTRSDGGAPWRLERGAEVQVEFSEQPDFGHYILRSKMAGQEHDSTKYGPIEHDAQKANEFEDYFYQEVTEAGNRYVDSGQAQEAGGVN